MYQMIYTKKIKVGAAMYDEWMSRKTERKQKKNSLEHNIQKLPSKNGMD